MRCLSRAHLRAEHGLHPSQLGQPVSTASGGVQHISHAHICLAAEHFAEEKPVIVHDGQADNRQNQSNKGRVKIKCRLVFCLQPRVGVSPTSFGRVNSSVNGVG